MGTTSAYAENTGPRSGPKPLTGNYLRVRGEYMPRQSRFGRAAELPPRTRRIPIFGDKRSFYGGTTSAYAENTLDITAKDEFAGNYLRVRGEYSPRSGEQPDPGELPPRTRRIRPVVWFRGCRLGTTSAYAENTPGEIGGRGHRGNYLRVRGEYAFYTVFTMNQKELPPRTRRIRHRPR